MGLTSLLYHGQGLEFYFLSISCSGVQKPVLVTKQQNTKNASAILYIKETQIENI